MKTLSIVKQEGVTLIELLIALAIFGIVMGAIYRLFIGQTKAYTVQDQVIEVQQTVRSTMDLLLRDLRMTGYDDDSVTSPVTITTPIATPVMDHDITIDYEYQNQRQTVRYWRDGLTSELKRELFVNGTPDANNPLVLLENVDDLAFKYGVDANEDGAVDDQNGDATIDDNDFVSAGSVGTSKVIAIRVTLTARPTTNNPDVQKIISERTLISTVSLRNLMMQ
jgi:prepilin-type N-terminal cleavage/methylation domain-containing protein